MNKFKEYNITIITETKLKKRVQDIKTKER